MTHPSVLSTDNSRKVSPLPKELDRLRMPGHIAVIMDGNGRWAKAKGKNRIFGHKNGVTAVRETVESAVENNIEFLTLYAFSTENWKRPKEEVNYLFSLLESLSSEIMNLPSTTKYGAFILFSINCQFKF